MRAVPCRAIVEDRELAYRDELGRWAGAEALRASVRRRGVLEPVLVQESEQGLRPVAGFRRLELCRELGLDEVPAHIAGRAEETFALFCGAVEAHAAQPINLRERLRALDVAERLGAPADRLIRELLPGLGLASEPHLLADLRELQGLSPGLRDLLADKAFSLRRCLPFTRLSAEDGERLAGTARRLGLGGRPIEELLVSLLEIAARDAVPVAALLDELEPAAATSREPLARLRARRYPETDRRVRALEQASRSMAAAAAGVALRWDPALARETVELWLRVGSVDELRRTARALDGEAAREALQAALREL